MCGVFPPSAWGLPSSRPAGPFFHLRSPLLGRGTARVDNDIFGDVGLHPPPSLSLPLPPYLQVGAVIFPTLKFILTWFDLT